MSRISVVTICYNEEKNIVETMESVLRQTYSDVEYVIKDGDSKDNTNKIIEGYLSKNKNVKHIIKNDTGIYNAMNQAVEACSGDWVIFINAGDVFASEDILEKVFQDNDLKGKEILYGNVLMDDNSGEFIWNGEIKKLPYEMPFAHPACFIRRKLLSEMKFDETYRIVADYELILRCYEEGCSFYNLNKTISKFKLDGVSSTEYLKKYKEHIQVLKKHNLYTFNQKLMYPVRIVVALIKEFIDYKIPKDIQIYLRRVYAKKIKKYV